MAFLTGVVKILGGVAIVAFRGMGDKKTLRVSDV
jgi:hypothetical protein